MPSLNLAVETELPISVRRTGTAITASIVTYQSGEVIGACLESLLGSTDRPLEVVVLDNASNDATLDRLSCFAGSTVVRQSCRNLGFGRAHNLALEGAEAGYFLLLNPDVKMAPGSLDQLADHLDDHPECGAVTPLLAEGDEGIHAGFELSYPGQRWLPSHWTTLPGRIATLKGACVLVRSEVFQGVGGFDRRFFLYAEDLDLSLHIRRAGYTLECLHGVVVDHVGGHAECTRPARVVAAQKYAALLQFYEKNYPNGTTRMLILRDLLRFSFRWLFYTLSPGRTASRKAQENLGRLKEWKRFVRSWHQSGSRRAPQARTPGSRVREGGQRPGWVRVRKDPGFR